MELARIISAAARDADGSIWTGSYHGTAIDAATQYGNPIAGYRDPSWDVEFELGFMDEDGDFMTREQAYERGVQLRQLRACADYRPGDPYGCIHSRDFRPVE
jgi:hypothetical protein